MDNMNDTTKKAFNRILITICVVAAVLIIGIWIWKSVQISNVKKESTAEMQLLKENVAKQIRQSDELHLKSLAKPLVWAIRTEMLKDNISQVNLYVNEMVKEKNFQKVTIVNDKGIAILSTNKKEEGKNFVSPAKFNYLLTDTTMVENINDSLLMMSSPVMGFNNRLGTLIITYSIQPALK